MSPNPSRACVKSGDVNFGNDSELDMRNFDESVRWIRWSKNEFSHSLSLEPMPRSRRGCHRPRPAWLGSQPLGDLAMRYSLREATPDDRTFAETLHERCYKDVVIRQFGAWDSEFQKQSFEHKWHPERYRIIVYCGAAVGVLSEELKPDHLFLSEIQIDPSAQNQGIGSAILTDLFDHARSLGVPIRLRVLRCSRALTLYERIGFRCYGRTDTHFLFEKSCESAASWHR